MWWEINNLKEVDTPALVIYPDRVKENISLLKSMVDHVERLRPHVKTNKSPQACSMMLEAGIQKFKCATIAEAEMLGSIGAPDVILAYQPTGPKAGRLAQLIKKFPKTHYSCLIDDEACAKAISSTMEAEGIQLNVWVDLNVGMNRTGADSEKAFSLFTTFQQSKGLRPIGIHAYDGHLRDADLELRKKKCDDSFSLVEKLVAKIKEHTGQSALIVAGGSPTFPIHSKRKDVECSPGTFIYWDTGYGNLLKEQPFLHAAIVLTRVISKPAEGLLCLDLGHKSIASENPLEKRVTFLNGPELLPISQSEEHLVVQTDRRNSYEVGHVFYGVPYHVCPTVALYDSAWVVKDQVASRKWENPARNRSLTV